ncbi:glycerophosphodiester phosphodiesterase [Paenibacillus yonginensis]|uniref:Glycerophosphodiester phosphodiesterase n=1 Tax=Paenibacillus yonginensis TaxID=1462996 RepID=A0A1B1MXA8_9BACL|nr:glycerophosphodiester phosphodiesterase family protein [Paenibacillus yonginensis]ANS73821.1 glycerophosphodiester phosphodiesterase [Paenibacillus yonginensis]
MNRYCAAHRGYSGVAPENTMAAVRMAMEEPCVTWMEVDVQLSKDGVPVIFHDYSVNRTTNGRGAVREKTFAELRKLDAGSWKSPFYAGEKIITLDELLDTVKGRLKLNLEIKTQEGMYPGLENKMIDAVRSRNMQDDVVMTSFDVAALGKVKFEDPGIQTGLITDRQTPELFRRLKDLGCNFLSMAHRKIDERLVAEAGRRKIQIMAWTVDRPKSMLRLAALDRNILICTNRPGIFRETFIETEAIKPKRKWWRLGGR